VLFISSTKRFKTKSNLLRIIFFLRAVSKFHFHGIKSLRLLKLSKFFCIYFLSFSRNFWDELSIKGTSFFRSFIGAINNINRSLFNFSSNTYSHALVFSANESVNVKLNNPGFYGFTISPLKLIIQIPIWNFQ
jgi:hypothetical protein